MKAKYILLIEDNKDLRENTAELLELAGYSVAAAADGLEGLKSVNQSKPDLILCDIMMPNLDGYGVMKTLKSNPNFRDIPLIFLTAKAEKDDFRKGMSLGATDYLTKPFDYADLIDAVKTRLDTPTTSHWHHGWETQDAMAFIVDKLLEYCPNCEEKSLHRRDVIYNGGTNPKNIFIVSKGFVKRTISNDYGKEWISHIYSVGEVVGLDTIICGPDSVVNISAMTDVILKALPVETVVQKMLADPDLSLATNKYLSMDACVIYDRTLTLAYGSLRKKVADALCYLFERMRDNKFDVMRDDMAAIAGVAKESLSRTLSDFKEERLIEIEDGAIILKDIHKLIHMMD
jgi:CheY-like chemotaxis protein/CRP-like cAMP-binding protein